MTRIGIAIEGKKRMLAAIVTLAFALAVALGPAMPMQASAVEDKTGLTAGNAQVSIQDDVTMLNPTLVDLWAGDQDIMNLNWFLASVDDNTQIINAVSSNPSILKVKKLDSNKSMWSYQVYPLKVGDAKLTITIVQSGKKKTLSETYTVKTFKSPFTSITLNGKSLSLPTSKAPFTTDYHFGFKGTSAKINVKTASGWTISSMSANLYSLSSAASKNIEITNGKAFTIPKGHECTIGINFFNSASQTSIYYNVYVNRDMPLVLSTNPTYYIGYPKLIMPLISSTFNPYYITILSVTSSKPDVIKAKSNKLYSKITLQAKKPGKSKIAIKYKYRDKTFTASAVSAVSNDYPLKSVKVNGKPLNLKKDSRGYSKFDYKKSTAKTKVAAAKGWKVKSVKYYYGFNDTKAKKIKNGKSVKTPKGQTTSVIATLKKGKKTFTYRFFFSRA